MSNLPCEGTPVLGYGAYLQVQDPTDNEWLYVAGLTDFSGPNITRGEIDATRLCSTGKEYMLDLKDAGTFTATMQTMLGTRSHRLLMSGLDGTDAFNIRLAIPDDGLGNGAVIIEFTARVSGFPISGSQAQLITTSLSLRITGDIKINYPGSLGTRLEYSGFILNESSENDGTVAGVVSIVLDGDTFAGTMGEALAGVTFTGVPDGLTANIQKINGSTAVLTFSGAATDHDPDTSAVIGVNFGNAAFTTGPASAVSGASNRQLTIHFI